MLFRRQNDQTMPVNTTQPIKPLTAKPPQQAVRTPVTDNTVRPVPLTATPTQPIAQAQQRRMIATPAGTYSLPANNSGTREGSRKLQVGRDITLNGEIGACDHLAIEGTVTATIKQLQQFDILDHGQFSGSVTTENADINGHFNGELTVTGRLWLRQNATVSGTIRYAALQVEKGACLRGNVDMLEAKAPAAPLTFSSEAVANDTTHGE